MAAKRKRAEPALDINQLVERARAVVDESGSIALAKLAPASVRSAVVERLVSEGLEGTPKVVRQPLSAQLQKALAEGAAIPLKTCARHVAGASAAEAQKAGLGLVADGHAHLVLRGKVPTLYSRSAAVLSEEGVRRLVEFGKTVQAALKSKQRATLLESDLRELFEAVLPATKTKPGAGGREATLERVLRAVDEAHDAGLGLSFVPRVVQLLGRELGVGTAKSALVEAASRGLLELRPEGGMARLSRAELELCPPGPQGTWLSWARRS